MKEGTIGRFSLNKYSVPKLEIVCLESKKEQVSALILTLISDDIVDNPDLFQVHVREVVHPAILHSINTEKLDQ